MNNPLRAYVQEKIEIPQLIKRTASTSTGIVLEVGCGNGTGTKLIKKYFNPTEIHAIDLDQRMIDRAQKRHSNLANFSVGNATKLIFSDNYFDTIFDFGIIHHIPNWQNCLQELYRVLKPGGQLILEDLSIESFHYSIGKLLKYILKHPYKQMYTQDQFISYLKQLGFSIIHQDTLYPASLLRYFVVVAKK